MTAEQFAYWLQGFMEIENPLNLNALQTAIIKDHLALVFNKQTPDRTEIVAPKISITDPHDFPYWQQPTMPQWQEPHIVTEPSKLNPICSAGGTNPDFTKKFC